MAIMGRQPENGMINKKTMARIETAVKRALKDYAEIIHGEMQEAFEKVIHDFYADYKPHALPYVMYHGKPKKTRKRTESLYKASSGWNKKTSKNDIVEIEHGYAIHLYIGSDIMKQHGVTGKRGSKTAIYRADVEWVFNRSYSGFIHGFTKQENEEWNKNTKWWMPWEDDYRSRSAYFKGYAGKREGRPFGDYITVPIDKVPKSGKADYTVEYTGATRISKRGLDKWMDVNISKIKHSLKKDKRYYDLLRKRLFK